LGLTATVAAAALTLVWVASISGPGAADETPPAVGVRGAEASVAECTAATAQVSPRPRRVVDGVPQICTAWGWLDFEPLRAALAEYWREHPEEFPKVRR
jgi:hypothetical protein